MPYDGSRKWDGIEAGLRRDGYALSFSCASFDEPPAEVGYTGREKGWELRRKIVGYCKLMKIEDFHVVRNTSYLPDLHGNCVYQLWVHRTKDLPGLS